MPRLPTSATHFNADDPGFIQAIPEGAYRVADSQ